MIALTQAGHKNLTLTELYRRRGEARRLLCQRRLTQFCTAIDPKVADKYNARHLRRIADELEKVERGEIERLYITTPPRHWKSSTVSEKFALWYLGRNPTHSVGLFSHGQGLVTKFSVNIRSNIQGNERVHEIFPHLKLKEGSNNKNDWSLHGSFRSSLRAFGVGGSPTGEGFDLIIIDDPVADAAEAYSPTVLTNIWTWYKETLRDRLNPGGKIILVMSRWHENDLAGNVMRESLAGTGENWHELRLPAIAEEKDIMGRQVGEALWPEQWPVEALDQIKLSQGARAFAAKFQGSPRALQGNILDKTLLVMIEPEELGTLGPLVRQIRHWDLAFSDTKAADFSSGCKMGLTSTGKRVILDIKEVKGKWPQTEQIIRRYAPLDGRKVYVSIECNGTQLGYADSMKVDTRMRGYVVSGYKPEGSKEMRAALWGTRLEDRIIYCVRGAWNNALFEQMDFFPNYSHDDIIDSVSGAWAQLSAPTGAMDVNNLIGSSAPDEMGLSSEPFPAGSFG